VPGGLNAWASAGTSIHTDLVIVRGEAPSMAAGAWWPGRARLARSSPGLSLYRKLGAASRSQAVTPSRGLGLLDG